MSPAPTTTRRRFIKDTLLLASAPMLCSFPLYGKEAPSNRLNLALIGCGWVGVDSDLKEALACGANIVAVCDVDEAQTRKAIKAGGEATKAAVAYEDYRQLLDREKALDGVIIATPDHWHAPISRLYLRAGKHVYCEKPLTRTLGEARQIRALALASKGVTQMGNQGSAYVTVRRGIEVIRAGALGTVTSAHVLVPAERFGTGISRPPGEDPVPAGLNWDFWVGPSPLRPYKTDIYHPYKWRSWHDFGTGQMGNWGTHCLNLPIRALKLGLPNRVDLINPRGLGFESYWSGGTIAFRFESGLNGAPFTAYWHENEPTPEPFQGLPPNDAGTAGVVLIGDRGRIYTNPHNGHALIKLEGEAHWKDLLHHEATQSVPVTLPRVDGHMQEWMDGCRGGPKPYSSFEVGSMMTETCLLGLLATQLGRSFDYDAEKQGPVGIEAEGFIHPPMRGKWMAD